MRDANWMLLQMVAELFELIEGRKTASMLLLLLLLQDQAQGGAFFRSLQSGKS